MAAIEFNCVTKSFARNRGQQLIRDRLSGILSRRWASRFYALRQVSFEVAKGESLALIGSNGAGKSTALTLIGGLSVPDSGTVKVAGNVGALLELGSGFHPDLTGAENVRLNAALIGLSRQRTNALFEEIVEFSGVRDFMEQPLRTFSTGMAMRLAFSVAIHLDPDVLLIDEVIAVGDQEFQIKCIDRIRRLRGAGKTLVCVSHSMQSLQELCDRAVWLEHGMAVSCGDLESVADSYVASRSAHAGS